MDEIFFSFCLDIASLALRNAVRAKPATTPSLARTSIGSYLGLNRTTKLRSFRPEPYFRIDEDGILYSKTRLLKRGAWFFPFKRRLDNVDESFSATKEAVRALKAQGKI